MMVRRFFLVGFEDYLENAQPVVLKNDLVIIGGHDHCVKVGVPLCRVVLIYDV